MPDVKKIYIVEDEKHISDIINMYLHKEGFTVTQFFRGDTALEALVNEPPDLAILDIMLPGLDGLEILKNIRRKNSLPVIFLTSKKDELDKILGLELGADDYVPKPFSPRELVARVKSIFRRVEKPRNKDVDEVVKSVISARRMSLDLESRKLTVGDHTVRLTPTEFSLLWMLMEKPGRVFSRADVMEKIGVYEGCVETRTVDVHIKNLRKKIEKAGGWADSIQSVRGVGYKFED